MATVAFGQCVLYLPAVLGHMMLWVGVHNRLHALGIRQVYIELCDKLAFLLALLIPCGLLWLWYDADRAGTPMSHAAQVALSSYVGICWVALIWGVPRWWKIRKAEGRCASVQSHRTRDVKVDQRLGGRPVGDLLTRISVHIPGNQVFNLQVSEKEIVLPRLPEQLDGMTIAHLSDLHLSGRILPPFFEAVVAETNSFHPDLIMIAGDIVDAEACIAWIPEIFGKLRSRCGAYFVLGNHDRRVPSPEAVRKAMSLCGMTDLGGRVQRTSLRGVEIMLAGNEAPWFYPVPEIPPMPDAGDGPFRLLLSHAPDQLPWARQNHFDLMLAGHTHGGQIRIPGLGPIISPSRFGIRYSDGTFLEPPTTMHVSRGVSALHTLRFNCPPELAVLTLRRVGDAAQ